MKGRRDVLACRVAAAIVGGQLMLQSLTSQGSTLVANDYVHFVVLRGHVIGVAEDIPVVGHILRVRVEKKFDA